MDLANLSSGSPNSVVELARQDLQLGQRQLYLAYLAMGGNQTSNAIEEFLAGQRQLERGEFDCLAAALNDFFTALGADHPVPMSEHFGDQLQPDSPGSV